MMKNVFIVILALLIDSTPLDWMTARVEANITKEHAIYIRSNGWHTGFIIPAETLEAALPLLKTRFGDTPFMEVGWGDKGFYQAKKITSGLTLTAMFHSTGSVIHVVAVPEQIKTHYPTNKLEKLCLSHEEYTHFIDFIANSFAKDTTGTLIPLTKGIDGNSQFYEGIGTYHLLNTCNKWTAQGLQQAGLDIYPTVNLTSNGVMSYLHYYKHALNNAERCP
jgi:uncharacterized protein (TIGR02117 family)